jgi:hypothetical protein
LVVPVPLAAEQVLKRIEPLAHGVDVAPKGHHGMEEGIPVVTRIATAAPQPAAQGAVGNADAMGTRAVRGISLH